MGSFTVGKDLALGAFAFGATKLTKNADFGKHKYSGYGIGFDARGSYSLSDGSGFGKNVIIFGTDKSSSVHIDNKMKDILILGKVPTDALNATTLTEKKECSIMLLSNRRNFAYVCIIMR